jgi:predicted nucleic acid-binding protein
MSDRYFVDTNILVYAHDRLAGAKHDLARTLVESLWESGQGVVSTQVLQELCINLRRKISKPLSVAEVRQLVRDYSVWEVITNTPESILEALDIESRYKTSFWDALIVQAADASGASVLYSEDLGDGQKYGTLRVINPLKITTPTSSSPQAPPTALP